MINNQQLFRHEIRASVAHCNGLFRAGVITKLESERLKNALWTILKRAEFDRNYFDSSNSIDVFAFLEVRLSQLVDQAADTLKIGRSAPHRAALALRLWLREETEIICELLTNLSEILQKTQNSSVCSNFAENLKQDETRFAEILERINQMPSPLLDTSDEATAEIDFDLIAHELGLKKPSKNLFDFVDDRDFCVEFAAATALSNLHLSNLANAVVSSFEIKIAANRQALELVRGKAVKTFGHHAILLSLLKGIPNEANGELNAVCEIVFDAAENLKSCLQITAKAFSATTS